MTRSSSPRLHGIDTIDPPYYTPGMAMGRRKDRARTPGLWIAANELPPTGGHPFYSLVLLEYHNRRSVELAVTRSDIWTPATKGGYLLAPRLTSC
jgi:hypothetical protein